MKRSKLAALKICQMKLYGLCTNMKVILLLLLLNIKEEYTLKVGDKKKHDITRQEYLSLMDKLEILDCNDFNKD